MKARIMAIAILMFAGAVAATRVNAQQISKNEVKTLLSNARTPEDHQKLADYFAQETNRLTAEAAKHQAEIAEREKTPSYFAAKNPAVFGPQHCRDAAKRLRGEAAKAQTQAEQHAEMARQVSN